MNDKLIIFDTTLRDGEQSPGASMTRDEKVLCPSCGSKQTVRELSVFAVAADSGKKTSLPAGCGRCGGPGPCQMD